MKQAVSAAIALYVCFGVFICCSFYTCNGQSKAMEDQQKVLAALGTYSPKGVPPGSNIYLKATINGKQWAANDLIPDTDPGSSYHVNGAKEGVRIAFYVTTAPYIEVGQTRKFSADFAADFFYNDDVGIYGGRSGSYTITKVDDDGFEAIFHFTAGTVRGNSNVFEIADGTLRFPFAKRKK